MEKIVANFSNLSDQECAFAIRNNLLEALETDTTFEWELIAKLLDVGYETREHLCRFFDNALKQNEQKISGIAVKDWLRRYLLRYPLETINLNTFFEYVAKSPETRELNDKDKIRLLRIFRIRDYLFASPIFDMEDKAISSILRFPMRLSQTPKEIWTEMQSAETETSFATQAASEKLAVKEALHKFPNLGEQSVTASAIKLKQFDHPVRPSVRNWLYDYTMQLGQTGHSSMDRTNYLFRSDNTKNLSSPEREKLAILLKSFDENTSLPIDGKRQEIVFESFTRKEAPPQRTFPAEPKPATSVNFIRPVERPSASSKVQLFPPAAREQRGSESQTLSEEKFSPIQRQENSFVRYYSKPEIPKTQTFEDAPIKIDEDKIAYTNPYPKPGTHETQLEKSDDNISNIRFSEGAPKDYFTSISQVSAKKIPTEGLSPSPIIPTRPLAPVQKSVPTSPTPVRSAYQFTPPNKNIIQPHYGGEARRDKPEPKIQGNTVDLREQ